jgi:hypothetical protein
VLLEAADGAVDGVVAFVPVVVGTAGAVVVGVGAGRLRTRLGRGGTIANDVPDRWSLPKRGLTVIFARRMNPPIAAASGSLAWTDASTRGRAFSGVSASASITWKPNWVCTGDEI